MKALDIACTQCGAEPGVACPFPIPGGYAGVYDYAHRVRVDEAHRLTFPAGYLARLIYEHKEEA